MNTIAEKLALLEQTKAAIKAAIEAKGQTVGDIPFSQYPAKIAAIAAAASAYYLRLDDSDEDQSVTVGAYASSALYAWTVTSDGTPYLVSSDSRLSVDLYEEDGDMYLSVAAPNNTSIAPIEYDPVILGIREDSSLLRKATVSQQGANAYLSINGNRSDFAVEASADGEVLELTYATNGTPQVQTFEGDAIDSVDIQEGVIQIATLPNASTAEREGLVVIELAEDPSISITVTVKQAASESSYYLTVEESDVSLSASRQTYSIDCNTNGTLKIVSEMDLDNFITATVTSGQLNISVAKNSSEFSRAGSVTLGIMEDSTVTAVVYISQDGTSGGLV